MRGIHSPCCGRQRRLAICQPPCDEELRTHSHPYGVVRFFFFLFFSIPSPEGQEIGSRSSRRGRSSERLRDAYSRVRGNVGPQRQKPAVQSTDYWTSMLACVQVQHAQSVMVGGPFRPSVPASGVPSAGLRLHLLRQCSNEACLPFRSSVLSFSYLSQARAGTLIDPLGLVTMQAWAAGTRSALCRLGL